MKNESILRMTPDELDKKFYDICMDNYILNKGTKLKDGEPCSHPGCLMHISHPCEVCGRIAGKSKLLKRSNR